MEQRPAPSTGKKPGEKTLPELMGDLSSQVTELVSAEIAIVKARVMAKVSLVGQGAALIVGALFSLLVAFACCTALIIIALATFMPPWLAALIVTGFWLLAAVVLALAGKNRISKASAPDQYGKEETRKEDAEWAAKPNG